MPPSPDQQSPSHRGPERPDDIVGRTSAAAPPTRLRDHWRALTALLVATFVVTLDNSVLNVALPSISRELRVGTSTLEWVAGAYSLLFGGLLLTGGTVADRLGHRRVLLVGMAAFGTISLVSLVVQDGAQLIALRAALGAAAAFVMPGTLALLFRTFAGPARASAVGAWGAVAGLGFAVGPMVGGAILEHFTWRAVFVVNVPLAVLALVLVAVAIPGGEPRRPGRVDVPGTLLSVGALGGLVAALIEAPDAGWTSPVVLGLAAAAVVAAFAFVAWERRAPVPMLDVALLRLPGVGGAAASEAAVFFGMAGLLFLVTQQLQAVAGHSPFQAGLRSMPLAAGAILAGPVGDRVLARLGAPRAAAVGLLLGAVGLAVVAVGTPHGYGWLVVGGLLFGGGLRTALAPISMSVVDSLPANAEGLGSALNDTAQEVGGALGVAVLGSLFSAVFRSGLPDAVPDAARGSVQAVFSSSDPAVLAAARHAFGDGMEVAVLVGAAVLLVASATALRTIRTAPVAGAPSPAQARRRASSRASQNATTSPDGSA